MARYGVTYDEVHRAIEIIQEAGMCPTIDRVREMLGTGSKTTISALVNKWKKNNNSRLNSSCISLPDELSVSVKKIYESIQASADAKISQYSDECKIKIDEICSSLDAMKVANDDLAAELSALREKEKIFTSENKMLIDKLYDNEKIILQIKTKLDESHKIIDDYRIRFDEKTQENRMIRDNFEHYCQKMSEYRQRDIEESHAMKEQLRNEAAIFKNRSLELKNDVEKKVLELIEIRNSLECVLKENNELLLGKERILSENNILNNQINFLNIKIDEKDSIIRNLEKEVVELMCCVDKHSNELKDNVGTINKAKDKVASIEIEHEKLSNEYHYLQGRLNQLESILSIIIHKD
ncbi:MULTISPECIES: DNA-binding protein [Candidatus Ichthyocystis]|uniref:DNA binding protein, KfrA family n=1 Tax=Candidatus Ichthyocystis hellenicum TaxID=1561003 RepID=A0A0S4M4L6_9BURK|nr:MULTISPECIES: DNA-binding protein [Ichthyocystis]CUT17916.1 DNA binding protein, KfrA family [Candidatus Ichthyocystis hellenicum]